MLSVSYAGKNAYSTGSTSGVLRGGASGAHRCYGLAHCGGGGECPPKGVVKISLNVTLSQWYLSNVFNWGSRVQFAIFCWLRFQSGGPFILILNIEQKNKK